MTSTRKVARWHQSLSVTIMGVLSSMPKIPRRKHQYFGRSQYDDTPPTLSELAEQVHSAGWHATPNQIAKVAREMGFACKVVRYKGRSIRTIVIATTGPQPVILPVVPLTKREQTEQTVEAAVPKVEASLARRRIRRSEPGNYDLGFPYYASNDDSRLPLTMHSLSEELDMPNKILVKALHKLGSYTRRVLIKKKRSKAWRNAIIPSEEIAPVLPRFGSTAIFSQNPHPSS